jgi:AcrR family transcriptional regulator
MATLLSLSLDTTVVLPLEVYQMGRPAADQEQIHAFRIMAIEAAWRVFERGGEQAVTTRAVAAELGCSPMTAYRYFENHEALVNYLRAEAFQRFASFLRSKGEKEPDLRKRIDAVSRAYVGYGIKNMETYKLMFNHSAAVSPGPSVKGRVIPHPRAIHIPPPKTGGAGGVSRFWRSGFCCVRTVDFFSV